MLWCPAKRRETVVNGESAGGWGVYGSRVSFTMADISGKTMVREEDERRGEGGVGEREREGGRTDQELVVLAELHALFSQEPEALLPLRFFKKKQGKVACQTGTNRRTKQRSAQLTRIEGSSL
jgi:hypothetical protein